MSTDLELIEPQPMAPASGNIIAIIERAASNPAVDVDKMERLLAMHERLVSRQAEVEFNAAMKAAQAEMPKPERDAHNPQTNSKYTRLETLNKAAVPIYTKHGFSLSFGTADCPLADHYRVTCTVAHEAGHSRPYQCDLPLDNLGPKGTPNKSKLHGAGSTMSYGRRYLTLLIFNISTGDDDDGTAGQKQKTQGPSSMQPDDAALKKLANELWEVLKPVRGTAHNWLAANQWLWRAEILDAAAQEAAPNLSVEKFKTVIQQAKEVLNAQ